MSNHQKYDLRAIDEFVLHPRNPRQGDIGAIAESIEANGWYGAIVTQKSTGYVIVGNHRLRAARQLGFTSLPTFELDVDDATALRIMLADNQSSDRASNDEGILAQLLQEIAAEQGDLAGTLYDGDDLDALLRKLGEDQPEWGSNMPEFTHGDKKGAYQTTVHFLTNADADAFFELIGRPRRTWNWWPADDGFQGSTRSEQVVADEPAE